MIANTLGPIMPFATVVASFALFAGLLFPGIRRQQQKLIVLTAGCAAAVLSRIVLIAYIAATSFGDGADRYVSPVSSLLIVFIVCGWYLMFLIGREVTKSFAEHR